MTDLAAKIPEIYERNAELFDRSRGKTLFERAWLDRFIECLPDKGVVLDIGCGSGEPIARYLIEQGLAVTGIDSSPELTALCRKRFPKHQWQVADMRTLSLTQTFDGIIAWDSFFHLTQFDQRRMFPVFGRHASACCALLYTSGPKQGETLGKLGEETLYHSSLDPSEYIDLLAAEEFETVHYIADDLECGGHTVRLAAKL
ncbi:MAG: class I SAM-dependent methyltransferase [Proteobacteria bacterium]|nr:class I SAM-dependent methyltransferase [Pseudomonadota bacterium]